MWDEEPGRRWGKLCFGKYLVKQILLLTWNVDNRFSMNHDSRWNFWKEWGFCICWLFSPDCSKKRTSQCFVGFQAKIKGNWEKSEIKGHMGSGGKKKKKGVLNVEIRIKNKKTLRYKGPLKILSWTKCSSLEVNKSQNKGMPSFQLYW